MSYDEQSSFPNKELPGPSERSKISEQLRLILSIDEDISLFKLSIWLEYQIIEGTYTDRVEILSKKYYRGKQTIKNIITEMKKEKPNILNNKLKKLKELLI